MREVLQLPREPERVAGVPGFERGEFNLRLFFVVDCFSALPFAFRSGKDAGVVHAHRAFGHGDDAEYSPEPAARLDGIGNYFNAVGNFGDQNHIGAASDARTEREPARVVLPTAMMIR